MYTTALDLEPRVRVLFVDDDARVLRALRRMLRPDQAHIHATYAMSVGEASQWLRNRSFDVLITDVSMPHIDGIDLLDRVADHYPQIVRVVLSGTSSGPRSVRAIPLAHQYLKKPIGYEALRAVIDRVWALKPLLSDRVRPTVAGVRTPPSIPGVYAELCQALEDPKLSLRRAGQIIQRDPAICARVLQIVNSAFVDEKLSITSIPEAVTRLGLPALKSLVVVSGVFSAFDSSRVPQGMSLKKLETHAMHTAHLAASMVTAQYRELAFTTAALHDIGILVLANEYTEQYESVLARVRNKEGSLHQLEEETFGTTHAEVGAYLLGIWGLPPPVVDAVAFHHDPASCRANDRTLVTALHCANALSMGDDDGGVIDPRVARAMGDARIQQWRRLSASLDVNSTMAA